ncbi:MAG TPA: hypothetical protein VHY34_06010 [Caulobacteraceae bacterium]|jgi:hypothetical protein|nr:hypothetical protein [Caulobacteraceae bacterium]
MAKNRNEEQMARFLGPIVWSRRVDTPGESEPPSPLTPDLPRQFGSKINWFAIKTVDVQSVAEALGLTGLRPSNWSNGIEDACQSSPEHPITVFVSPPVEGWTFVVGAGLPYPADSDRNGGNLPFGKRFRTLFGELSRRFEEVQFFGSDRVVDFSAWARAHNGQAIRVFSYVGAQGEVLANEGGQTPEERALGLIDPGSRNPADATDYLCEQEEALMDGEGEVTDADEDDSDGVTPKAFPDEDDVIDLAGRWSLNPYELEALNPEPALGWLAELKRE